MRNEKHLVDDVNVHQHAQRAAARTNGNSGRLQEVTHEPQPLVVSTWEKFLPHGRNLRMTQEARGVFIPYPLLAILVIIGGALLSFVIAIEVQVSNLNTTILLRDADTRAVIHDLQEKNAQLEVYVHSDREKLIKIETQGDFDNNRRR